MSVRRILNSAIELLRQESGEAARLQSLTLASDGERAFLWVNIAFLNPVSLSDLQSVLVAVGQLSQGEVVLVPALRRVVSQARHDELDLEEWHRLLAIYQPDGEAPGHVACQFHDNRSLLLRLAALAEPLDADLFRREILCQTWMGCSALPEPLAARRVRVEVGAQVVEVAPAARRQGAYVVAGQDRYYSVTPCPAREPGAVLHVFCLRAPPTTRHLSPEELLSSAGVQEQDWYGFPPEVSLEIDVFAEDAGFAVHDFLAQVSTRPEVRERVATVFRDAIQARKRATMERLEQRRRGIANRARLHLSDGDTTAWLGFVPTNENEVLLLTAKLQGFLSRALGEFTLLEHTPKADIDGLVRVRLMDDAPVRELAAVEFEYQLPNFFTHRHPIRQTDLIICWTLGGLEPGLFRFGVSGIDPNGPLQADLRRGPSWYFTLIADGHAVPVLALEKCPNLRVLRA